MEEWQKEYVRSNQNELEKVTTCNDALLALLLSDGVLANIDAEAIRCRTTELEKAQELYDILKTRKKGYRAAVKVLAECKQAEALKILVQGYAYCLSPNTPIYFLGKSKQLSEYFEQNEITEIIDLAKQKLSETQRIHSIENLDMSSKGITLVSNVKPPSSTLYIPRKLFKRITVNKTLFFPNCPDIFVFKGIHSLIQLSLLVNQKTASTSSTQLSHGRLTSRFILLEDDEDWERILEITSVPTHLIKYEEETGMYVLERTTGGSNIIGYHLGRPQGSVEDENADKVFSEDDFIDGIMTGSFYGSGICICDSPGMGKTLLLAKIANKIAELCPERLVAFISLSNFVQHITKHGIPSTVDYISARNSILEYLSTSPLSLCILEKVLLKFKVPMELLFDGFDEVNFNCIEFTKKLLRELSVSFPNSRVFVTSRPNLRHQLEASLGAIAYDIAPFTEANQIKFFVNFWKQDHQESVEEKLKVFAQSCLQSLRCKLTKEEKNITGIPLLCRLLAQVYSRNAKIFSRSTSNALTDAEDACIFETCLPKLYRKFMEANFEKLGDKMDSILQIKDYHIWVAFKTLFADFEANFIRQCNFTITDEVFDSVMSMGILEKRFIGNAETVEFMHRTFAEYFVAQFFADALKNLHRESAEYSEEFNVKIAKFLLKNILMAKDIGEADDFEGRVFIHSVVVYFLNFLTENIDISLQTKKLADQFPAAVCKPYQLYAMLFGCFRANYANIFKLFQNIFPALDPELVMKYKSEMIPDGDEYFLVHLINVASVFSSIPLVEALFTSFRECFSYDLALVCKRLPVHLDTPLHFAIEKADVEKIQFFAAHISLESRNILLSCVLKSNDDHPQIVKRKAEICKMLLEMNKNLLTEANYTLYDSVHVDLIKTLMEAGADARATKSGQNIVHRSAGYMSSSDFHQLCRFLLFEHKAEDLFLPNAPNWKSPLPYILRQQKNISIETCRIILGIPGVNLNEKDGKGNNLFHISVQEKHDTELLDILVKSGADVHVINSDGQNALHLAAQASHIPALNFLLHLGLNYGLQDSKGNSFLHLLAREEITAEEYHDIVSVLSANGQTDIFHLKNINGQLPLHLAVYQVEVKKDTLMLFKTALVDFNAVDEDNCTLLMYAAKAGRSVQFVSILVDVAKYGIREIMQRNIKGKTFTHLISKSYSAEQYHQLATFLISKGFGNEFKSTDNKKRTCLHWAALHFELCPETLQFIHRKLVKEGKVDINAQDDMGQSILTYAAIGKRSITFLKSLLEMGADVMLQDKEGCTFAHAIAARYSAQEFYEIIKLVIESGHGKVFQVTNARGVTPLQWAVAYLDCHPATWELIKRKLVETGIVNINSTDNCGCTILMYTILTAGRSTNTDTPLTFHVRNHPDNSFLSYHSLEKRWKPHALVAGRSTNYLRILVDMGVDLYVRDKYGCTFFHYFARISTAEQYHEVVQFLISRGERKVFSVASNDGVTPIHEAVLKLEQQEATLALFNSSLFQTNIVDINSTDADGNSILMWAAFGERSVTFLKTLIEMGADIHIQNKDGNSLAHFIPQLYSAEQYQEIVEYLISKGEQKIFSVASNNGVTPIHYAVLRVELNQATLNLLDFSLFQTNLVDVNSKDANGDSVLIYAAHGKRSVPFLKTLIEMGADVSILDKDGNNFAHWIPRHYSAEEYHEIVEFLVRRGEQNIFAVANHNGRTPILHAVFELELKKETVDLFDSSLFKTNIVDINSTDENEISVLMRAVGGKRSVTFLKTLIEVGADIHIQNKNGNNFAHAIPTFYSAVQYHEIVEYLISKGEQKVFAVANNDGKTPIHEAVLKSELQETTLHLFDSSLFKTNVVDINSTCALGGSILMYAAQGKRSVPFLTTLIEMGADIHIQDLGGNNFAHLIPEFYSAKQYHEIVDFLINKGKQKIFTVVNMYGGTPIHEAVFKLELLPETLDILLACCTSLHHQLVCTSGPQRKCSHGFNPVDDDKEPILHWALRGKRSLQFVKYLITLGADWSVKTDHNSTLAHESASAGLIEHLKFFVELGCDVNALDNDGDSVLQCAVGDATENIYEMVTFLLEKGADKYHKNNKEEQHTAFTYAIEKGISDKRVLHALKL